MSVRILQGDCRDVLPTLPANSVHCVVTSPPYFALRDYGTATWDGGDAACDHKASLPFVNPKNTLGHNGHLPITNASNQMHQRQFRDTCGKCGAKRVDRQIGLDESPEAYLATMVAVFREVKRVLRPDGTLWLNIGDSYASNGAGSWGSSDKSTLTTGSKNGAWAPGKTIGHVQRSAADCCFADRSDADSRSAKAQVKPKNLLMMPARLALALQEDGWWVRSDIIWSKPNPMPESVTDRPTSAYEHVFLLTKRATYFYDAEAVREPHTGLPPEYYGVALPSKDRGCDDPRVRVRDIANGAKREYNPAGRNLRNVWTIATHAYPQAHFATYPPELAERCIRAGTSERGCCAACGAPWKRTTETIHPSSWQDRKAVGHISNIGGSIKLQKENGAAYDFDNRAGGFGTPKVERTTGWAASCACGADVVPATVLDPFAGASTTLLVAQRLQRDAIGIELNPEYVTMGRQRIEDEAGLFANVQTLDGVPTDVTPVPGLAQPDLFPDAECIEIPAARNAFRTSGRYVHQTLEQNNSLPPGMAAD